MASLNEPNGDTVQYQNYCIGRPVNLREVLTAAVHRERESVPVSHLRQAPKCLPVPLKLGASIDRHGLARGARSDLLRARLRVQQRRSLLQTA
jgi:hypothetical protein